MPAAASRTVNQLYAEEHVSGHNFGALRRQGHEAVTSGTKSNMMLPAAPLPHSTSTQGDRARVQATGRWKAT